MTIATIVKVQQSIATTAPEPMCLVYNKSRSVMGEFPLTPEIAKALNGRPKAYFRALVGKDGAVSLDQEMGEQPW